MPHLHHQEQRADTAPLHTHSGPASPSADQDSGVKDRLITADQAPGEAEAVVEDAIAAAAITTSTKNTNTHRLAPHLPTGNKLRVSHEKDLQPAHEAVMDITTITAHEGLDITDTMAHEASVGEDEEDGVHGADAEVTEDLHLAAQAVLI
jgi:hypothetical protein